MSWKADQGCRLLLCAQSADLVKLRVRMPCIRLKFYTFNSFYHAASIGSASAEGQLGDSDSVRHSMLDEAPLQLRTSSGQWLHELS